MPKNDPFLVKLAQRKEELLTCQTSLQLGSCMACEKIFGCQTRQMYVKAVYESMSKGATGGFEF